MNEYSCWLDGIQGLGTGAKLRLGEAFGSPREIYEASEGYLNLILEGKKLDAFREAKKGRTPAQIREACEKEGIRFTCVWEENYPPALQMIPDKPFGIYYKGDLPSPEQISVAVIGARECSEYGIYVAKELGKELGRQGIQVISGMARGIDGICQEAVLEAGGASYAVLGCGVDICYPKSNRPLYDRLLQQGGILSTYSPGTQPQPRLFPPRNRIVSGLSQVVLVVEARQKSGTLITVDMALEQGKDVYAVPGRLIDRLSDGCNQLIRDGAMTFLSPEDFLESLRNTHPGFFIKPGKRNPGEEGPAMEAGRRPEGPPLLELLDLCPKSVDQIAREVREGKCKAYGTDSSSLLKDLMHLCLTGAAAQTTQGWFSRKT